MHRLYSGPEAAGAAVGAFRIKGASDICVTVDAASGGGDDSLGIHGAH